MTDWFADESFWETFYPAMFPDERFEATAAQVDQMLALTKFEGRDVLDLCCGPGRHASELAARGFNVTGVDKSAFLLGKARARSADVEWVHEDMRTFVRPDSFDLVINMFTSFGYFDDKEDDVRVLRNICASLHGSGVLIMEMTGKEYLAKVFQPTVSTRTPDGGLFVQRHEIFDDWTRIRNEWILLRGEQATSYRFHHTVYSAQELKDRLCGAGFRDVVVYGDLEGNEYGIDARRLVAVASK
jgi:SAM-dependent methyltransferase